MGRHNAINRVYPEKGLGSENIIVHHNILLGDGGIEFQKRIVECPEYPTQVRHACVICIHIYDIAQERRSSAKSAACHRFL